MSSPPANGLITNQRHLFDIPAERAWLNCAYMGPQLRSATAAGIVAAARKAAPWNITPEDVFTEPEEVRRLFALLIGADPDCIAIMPSASYGLELAARTLPLAAGQSVLVLAEEFPNNYYPWADRAKSVGATIETVPPPADSDWTAAVLERLKPGVAIAALPHCHWASGLVLDLVRIGKACRANGTRLVLDLTQSCGVIPFYIADVQPDFLVAATYKWLLGPYSVALAYISPAWHDARPIEHVWASRAGAEDFSGLVNYRDDTQPGARRFDVGERSNFALLPVVVAALRQLLDWQVERIAESLAAMTNHIAVRLERSGFSLPPQELRAPHILGVAVPPGASDIVTRLAEQQIHISQRGNLLRISPHLHVSDNDIDRLCDALHAIVQGQ